MSDDASNLYWATSVHHWKTKDMFITAKERSEGASIYKNDTDKTVPSTEVSVSSAGQMCQELSAAALAVEARSIPCQLVLGRIETVSRTVCGSVTVEVALLSFSVFQVKHHVASYNVHINHIYAY